MVDRIKELENDIRIKDQQIRDRDGMIEDVREELEDIFRSGVFGEERIGLVLLRLKLFTDIN